MRTLLRFLALIAFLPSLLVADGPGASSVFPNGATVGSAQKWKIQLNSTNGLDFRDLNNSASRLTLATNGAVIVPSAGTLGFAGDTLLNRDAANAMAQRNGTAAQSWSLYNTFTSSSVYERLAIDWITTANTVRLGTETIGGSVRNLWIQPNNQGGVGIGGGWVNDTSVLLHTKPGSGSSRAIWAQESAVNGTTLGIQMRGLNQAGTASTANWAAVFGAAGADNTYMAMSPANGSVGLSMTQGANLGLNGRSFGGGAGVFFILNATTLPTSNPTGGGVLYSDAGALKWRGPNGTTTQLAPP